jgi:hypothetical protein
MNLEGCLAIAFTVATVDPPLGAAIVGSCLKHTLNNEGICDILKLLSRIKGCFVF